MKNQLTYIEEIQKRLKNVVKKEGKKNSLTGFFSFLIISIVLFITLLFLESFFYFDSSIRTILYFAFIFTLLILLIYLSVIPLLKGYGVFKKIDFLKVASDVGSSFPIVKDELINSLQLVTNKNKYNSSLELIEKAFERTYLIIKPLDFTTIIDYSKTKKYFRISISILLLSILLMFLPFIQNAAHRVINYNVDFVTPPKFTINVIPGNATVTKGENLTIKILINGEVPNSIGLLTKSIEESEFSVIELYPDSSGQFVQNFNSLTNTFTYYASAQNIESPIYKIDVINRPIIRSMEISVLSPSYSKIPETFQKDNGNVSALIGSSVRLNLKSTKTLLSSNIVFSDSTKKTLSVKDDSAFVNFRIFKSVEYYISLVDKDGNENQNPVMYNIEALEDEYPVLDIISPNADVKLSNQNNISLHSKISDDYGFTKFVINYRLSESRYEKPWEQFSKIEIPFNNKSREEEVFYNWNLSSLNLAVDDVVSYYLEIYDNDIIKGPKSAKSKLFHIRVPSLDELFNQADETQIEAEKDLAETLKEAEKLSKEFEKISDELKQDNKELSFEEKERIQNALDKFEELGNKVEDVQKQLSKMQEELQQNDLLSKETLEKYMELQQLMDELTGEEYKDVLQKMQEMMEKLQRDQAQNSFEDMKLNEENFKKSIERTLNLLKRIQIEQKVDELIKRSENLMDKQEELENQTQQSGQNKEDINKKQDQISKELESFKKELEKLRDKLSEVPDMPQEEMKKLLDEFEKQNNEQLSEKAKENLQKNQKQQAMQNQQQISQNMSQMNQMLQDLQQSMQMQNQLQTLQDMMKIIDNILSVSKDQEELKDALKDLSFNSPQLNQNAQKQNKLRGDLSKILTQMSNASQKTFAITPEMGKAIGKALSDMNQSLNSMQSGNASGSAKDQNSAMANLNEAASMMNNMLNSMMSGGGAGGGMMSLMQQMQQLSQQQMQLNQMTQMLNQGMLSQEQMGQLQRLSQEQEIIRKSLEQLNKESKESGQSKKMPANLDKILQDMKEVITDMQTQKLGDDLIQKQERILSKLLDAQRSINERDFEKERESFAGKNTKRDSPTELLLNSEEGKDKLRDELLKAIREGYLKDYEDLIRKYYEALSKENKK